MLASKNTHSCQQTRRITKRKMFKFEVDVKDKGVQTSILDVSTSEAVMLSVLVASEQKIGGVQAFYNDGETRRLLKGNHNGIHRDVSASCAEILRNAVITEQRKPGKGYAGRTVMDVTLPSLQKTINMSMMTFNNKIVSINIIENGIPVTPITPNLFTAEERKVLKELTEREITSVTPNLSNAEKSPENELLACCWTNDAGRDMMIVGQDEEHDSWIAVCLNDPAGNPAYLVENQEAEKAIPLQDFISQKLGRNLILQTKRYDVKQQMPYLLRMSLSDGTANCIVGYDMIAGQYLQIDLSDGKESRVNDWDLDKYIEPGHMLKDIMSKNGYTFKGAEAYFDTIGIHGVELSMTVGRDTASGIALYKHVSINDRASDRDVTTQAQLSPVHIARNGWNEGMEKIQLSDEASLSLDLYQHNLASSQCPDLIKIYHYLNDKDKGPFADKVNRYVSNVVLSNGKAPEVVQRALDARQRRDLEKYLSTFTYPDTVKNIMDTLDRGEAFDIKSEFQLDDTIPDKAAVIREALDTEPSQIALRGFGGFEDFTWDDNRTQADGWRIGPGGLSDRSDTGGWFAQDSRFGSEISDNSQLPFWNQSAAHTEGWRTVLDTYPSADMAIQHYRSESMEHNTPRGVDMGTYPSADMAIQHYRSESMGYNTPQSVGAGTYPSADMAIQHYRSESMEHNTPQRTGIYPSERYGYTVFRSESMGYNTPGGVGTGTHTPTDYRVRQAQEEISDAVDKIRASANMFAQCEKLGLSEELANALDTTFGAKYGNTASGTHNHNPLEDILKEAREQTAGGRSAKETMERNTPDIRQQR